jgi:hypothetical protein
MSALTFLSRLTLYAAVGAVLGLLVGLVLDAVGVLDNPFWGIAVGIFVAAVLTPLRARST